MEQVFSSAKYVIATKMKFQKEWDWDIITHTKNTKEIISSNFVEARSIFFFVTWLAEKIAYFCSEMGDARKSVKI